MKEYLGEKEVLFRDANNTLSIGPELQLSTDDSYTLTNAYHVSEIKQNDEIIKTAKRIIWAGFVVIVAGVIMALFGKTSAAIITTIAGIISEFISGTIFAFVTMSNKSKFEYFKQLSLTVEGEKIMQMIMGMDNKKAQEKQIDKMVTNYCNRRNTTNTK